MVHVTTPRPNLGGALGSALSQVAVPHLQQQNLFRQQQFLQNQENQRQQQLQEQQQSMLNQALSEAQKVYSNPNLSPEQKQIGLFQALQNNPEMAKSLGEQLQKIQKQSQSQALLNNIFGPNLGQQQGQPQGQQQQQGQEFNPSNLSDAQIAQLALYDPNLAKVVQQQKNELQSQQQMKQKRSWELEDLQRKEETEISKPILLELNQARKNIPLQEQAIEDIKTASPDVGWRDYFADTLGIEPLRSAEGAKLKTAIKDFFLSDLTRAGAKPNQWIEQQLADALPKIGRDPKSNLITAEGLQFKVDVAKKRMETVDRLAEKDKKKYGYVKGNIDSRAYKQMLPYVKERQKDLQNKIKQIKDNKDNSQKPEKGFIRMKNPESGEVYDIPINDANEARKAGWMNL